MQCYLEVRLSKSDCAATKLFFFFTCENSESANSVTTTTNPETFAALFQHSQHLPEYTVKKANGIFHFQGNFPLSLLENPIIGSEQK
jgi:hypothetical protein